MHLQIDSYTKNAGDGEYDLIHRAYCQVKVFCDKTGLSQYGYA